MGVQDELSFRAAKKYKNVSEAISFILDQETKSAANNNNNNNTTYSLYQ